MSERKTLEEMLAKEFGIGNEKELDRALREMKKINIAVFVQKVQSPERKRKKVCAN